jgi:filamentous hemagglutinin
VEQRDFPWIRSRQDFREFIARVMRNPTEKKPLKGGRTAYWDEETGTIVVRDPKHPDGGTAFRPDEGKYYYEHRLSK